MNESVHELMSNIGVCRAALTLPGSSKHNYVYFKRQGKEKNNKPTCLRIRKVCKLDGVGPVDNRPPTDYLNPFVKKRRNK